MYTFWNRFPILYLQHAAVDKRDSIIPAPPASAFGDDEEDYQRVTKQQKSDEQKAASGEKDETTNFGKATFSKAPRGVEELVSVQILIHLEHGLCLEIIEVPEIIQVQVVQNLTLGRQSRIR